jgi:hypothetical protein
VIVPSDRTVVIEADSDVAPVERDRLPPIRRVEA